MSGEDERCDGCGRLDPASCPCPEPKTHRFVVWVASTVAFAVEAVDAEEAAYIAETDPSSCRVLDTIDGPNAVRTVQEDAP